MPGKVRFGLILFVCILLASALVMFLQNIIPPQLGHQNGRLKPLPSTPNAVSSQSTDPARHVAPLMFKASREATHQALIDAAMKWGHARIVVDQPDYLHIVFSTPTMRFRDDVEFYLDSTRGKVDIRSASRSGYSDMGLNRTRYEAIRKYYQDVN